jgi:hypothetical protein
VERRAASPADGDGPAAAWHLGGGDASAPVGRGAAGHPAADAGGTGGAADGEGPQVAPAQLQTLRRQAQVRLCRGAEGGHAPRARPQNHQVTSRSAPAWGVRGSTIRSWLSFTVIVSVLCSDGYVLGGSVVVPRCNGSNWLLV